MDPSLRERYTSASNVRTRLESGEWPDSTSAEYQSALQTCLASYEECLLMTERLALFSTNETLEDLQTNDLPYLLLPFHIGNLLSRTMGNGSRQAILDSSRASYERFLAQLDRHEMLAKIEHTAYAAYLEAPTSYSTVSTTDATARRNAKVAGFKAEKEMKRKLEYLRQNPAYVEGDEDAARQLYLSEIALAVHQTFQALEGIVREEDVLALAPTAEDVTARSAATQNGNGDGDRARQRDRQNGTSTSDTYSDRLDAHPSTSSSTSRQGPILSLTGRPLQPFTLTSTSSTSSRQALRSGVFRPGHNLPTMSIDEYLEEERRRGGIIDGGGEASRVTEEVDEDDYAKGEEATMKARRWDEFVESNPKGSGNTLNKG